MTGSHTGSNLSATIAEVDNARESLKRFLIWVVVLACVAYLSLTARLYYSQRDMLYFPPPALAAPAGQAFDLRSHGLDLHGWVINPGNQQALLFFGGSAESVEREATFFRDNLPGISVYLIPYRGYSGNPGTPTEAGLFSDALTAYDYVATRHPTVAIMGRSLGTGVAVYVAVKRQVARMLLVTPYDSIENIAQDQYPMFPVRLLMKDKFESWQRAPQVRAPTLILVAADDTVVPRRYTDHLISTFTPRPQVVVVDHADHTTILAKREYSDAIRKFLGG